MEGRKATVVLDGEELNGRVEAVHGTGDKIDVRIDHPGSKKHGRVLTLPAEDVDVSESDEAEKTESHASPADLNKFARQIHDRFSEVEQEISHVKTSLADLEAKLTAAINASLAPAEVDPKHPPKGGKAQSA